ncbi:MAG: DUF5678 domain-containing protein [Blastocatellia bacterium]|nr:DUF5678 domain-containing protein [Blastocatellia bacterium]
MNQETFDHVLSVVQQWPVAEREKLIRALADQERNDKNDKDAPGRYVPRRVPPPVESKDRTRENLWLAEHQHSYVGEWIAIEGDQLIAHGADADGVFQAAEASGVDRPLVIYVDALDDPPFAGW